MSPSNDVPVAPSLRGRRRPLEGMIRVLLFACGAVSVATTAGIILVLASETVGFFREVPLVDYLTGTRWAPNFGSEASFGVLPLLNGTLLVTAVAVAVAVPIGLGIAIFLSEYAPTRLRKWLKPLLEILAGIPTVVLGFFALNFVTQKVLEPRLDSIDRFNALSAGIVVGIMIVPLIASLSEDSLRAVPASLREAAYGLGATKRIAALRVLVPAALSGIAASVILGISRALGETMIVAIAAGNQPTMTLSPLRSVQTMTAYIVQVSLGDTPAGSLAYRTIFAVGATLFLFTLSLNIISLRIVRRFRAVYV